MLSYYELYDAGCRAIRQLHREACKELQVNQECVDDMERLLNELQQLLVGISIMQVPPAIHLTAPAPSPRSMANCSPFVRQTGYLH